MSGLFITFEGIEGSGKSSQISSLSVKLKSVGFDVLVTREPGGTPVGSAIRKILLNPDSGKIDPVTELFLFSAARKELVERVIKPALCEGKIVLCDRFTDSTMAYQGYGRGVDKKLIRCMAKQAVGPVMPSLTVLLDLPAEQGLERAIGRMEKTGVGEGRFEGEPMEFHQRVRAGFLAISKSEPDRVKVVDSADPPEKVGAGIMDITRAVLS